MAHIRLSSLLLSISLFSLLSFSNGLSAMSQRQLDEKQMIWDASQGNIQRVSKWLSMGVSVNAKRAQDGMTALHWAAQNGQASVVGFLLSNGADPAVLNNKGQAALELAAGFGKKAAVDMILKKAKDPKKLVSQTNSRGQTALHWAAWKNQLGVIDCLLAYGADPNQRDGNNATPLHWTVSEMAACKLVAKGGSLSLRDRDNATPLHRLVRNNIGLEDVLGMTSFSPDLLNARDYEGDTPLFKAIYKGNLAPMATLIKAGADVNATNSRGQTPLETLLKRHKGAQTAVEFDSERYRQQRQHALNNQQVVRGVQILAQNQSLEANADSDRRRSLFGLACEIRCYSSMEKTALIELLREVLRLPQPSCK